MFAGIHSKDTVFLAPDFCESLIAEEMMLHFASSVSENFDVATIFTSADFLLMQFPLFCCIVKKIKSSLCCDFTAKRATGEGLISATSRHRKIAAGASR